MSSEASRLSTGAIELAMTEINTEMSFSDVHESTPHTSRSLMGVLDAVSQEMKNGQELKVKPAKPATIADENFDKPKIAHSTEQMSTLPLLNKGRGKRPFVVHHQLVVAISQDLLANVVSGAMADIQREMSIKNGYTCSPLIDIPLLVRRKPLLSRSVSHFKLQSMSTGNPPILNNRMLLAVTVDLCNDVVRLAMAELHTEFGLNRSTTKQASYNSAVCQQEALCGNILPAHKVMSLYDRSATQVHQENAVKSFPCLKELAAKISPQHGLLVQPGPGVAQESSKISTALPSLKDFAGETSVQLGLLTKPAKDYTYSSPTTEHLRQNAIEDISIGKPTIPSLKDLAAKMAAQYGLLVKPANKYPLPSAKVDDMKKKLTPNQKMLLERPGWIKQKGGTKQTKIPISLDRKKSAGKEKRSLNTSAVNSDQKMDIRKQRCSTVKMTPASNVAPGISKAKSKTQVEPTEANGHGNLVAKKMKTKNRKKLLTKIENGRYVSDKETVSLLRSLETRDDQVDEMLREIEDLEMLEKELKDKKNDDSKDIDLASLDKLLPTEMKSNVDNVTELTKSTSDHPIKALGINKGGVLSHKGNKNTAVNIKTQMAKALDDHPKVDASKKVNDVTECHATQKKTKRKKLSVNKEPDIVPRMNKHALRLKEENGRTSRAKQDNIKQEDTKFTKKKLSKMTDDMKDRPVNNRNETKIKNANMRTMEQTIARPTREPLRPVRTTKATEARLKHVERLKAEAADKEIQIINERQSDAEIQKTREISRVRALDPVRAKRRREMTQMKPWNPLPLKKTTRPARLPPIKQNKRVARQTQEIYHIASDGDDTVRDQKVVASPPVKSQRRLKASMGGLMIARM